MTWLPNEKLVIQARTLATQWRELGYHEMESLLNDLADAMALAVRPRPWWKRVLRFAGVVG